MIINVLLSSIVCGLNVLAIETSTQRTIRHLIHFSLDADVFTFEIYSLVSVAMKTIKISDKISEKMSKNPSAMFFLPPLSGRQKTSNQITEEFL